MAKCELFGKSLIVSDAYIRDHVLEARGVEASNEAEKEFFEWYKKQSGIESVMKGYADFAIDLVIKYAFNRLYGKLAGLGIYDVSEDYYLENVIAMDKINSAYSYVEDDIEEIIEDKKEKVQYRAARKANRGRFVGGGFGISGAIKGSLEAGALNATTGLAHGTANMVGNIGSSIGASMKKSALYNDDTRETLGTGVFLAVSITYFNHIELVNEHFPGYYDSNKSKTYIEKLDKADGLFENAKKIPEKRKELLYEAVNLVPDKEKILKYIFENYPEERKNVYKIGQLFELGFDKIVEESFSKLYTEDVKNDPVNTEKVKAEIIKTMAEYDIKKSATLTQLNDDVLSRIAGNYMADTEEGVNSQVIKEISEYDAPDKQKSKIIHDCGIWELAGKYSVSYSADEKEKLMQAYYSEEAKNDESKALAVKEKYKEIMAALSMEESTTFDQLEKDCIKRLCGDIDAADEEQCNLLKQEVCEYDALDKNKKECLDAIQARIEAIWSKEDGEIFDNVYMNTNIYDQGEINEAIKFIEERGRTSRSQKYIDALKACNAKNIEKAKEYKKKSSKALNIIGVILLLLGILEISDSLIVAVVLAVPGILLMISYSKKKKMWKLLTIDETQVHKMLLDEESIKNSKNVDVILDSDELKQEQVDANAVVQNQTCVEENKVTETTADVQSDVSGSVETPEEAERKAEELSRTLNGVVYPTIEAMNGAQKEYEEQKIADMKMKKANTHALVSMICGIVAYPLIFTLIFWIPALLSAVVFGILALKEKTQKKGYVIAGFILAGGLIGLSIIGALM